MPSESRIGTVVLTVQYDTRSSYYLDWLEAFERAPLFAVTTFNLFRSDQRRVAVRALREAEQAEATYLQSIDKLAALAQPKIEHPATPLMSSYREKLLLLDAAIADCRANVERNRANASLRHELGSLYQEKQRTLEEVLREE